MIADNLIYFAIAVFILIVIGLTLTILEFRYGTPQQQSRENRPKPAGRG